MNKNKKKFYSFICLFLLWNISNIANSNKTTNRDALTNLLPKSKKIKQKIQNKTSERVTDEKKSKYVHLNPETGFGPEIITNFKFKNISLKKLTKHMQKLTGINLLITDELNDKISISAISPITVGDAWKAYLQALNLHGYTLIKVGQFYNIQKFKNLQSQPLKIYTGDFTPETANHVIRILPLKNIDGTKIKTTLKLFINDHKNITLLKKTNTLIIRNTGSNINRLVKIVKMLDVPDHQASLHIIKIKNTLSKEIVELLKKIIVLKKQKNNYLTSSRDYNNIKINMLMSDPRTNSVIAMANEDGAKQLKSLIKKLDVKLTSTSTGLIHIYYLGYGNAKDFAETLGKILNNIQKSSKKSSKKNSIKFPFDEKEKKGLFRSKIHITHDEYNNALVITATSTDYMMIKNIIKKLDIPREQVYVEALILETKISKTMNGGISIVGKYDLGSLSYTGSLQGQSADFLKSLLQGSIGSIKGFFSGGSFGSAKIINNSGLGKAQRPINVLISALASDNNMNILANPQILAINNKTALFEVGESIPYIQKTTTTAGTTESIKYEDVKLSLEITPKINKISRTIQLKIKQSIQDITKRQLPASVQDQGYAISENTASTTILVKDEDTVVMGGLMRDKISLIQNKIPFLGDIPLLGWLFKSALKTVTKVNLMFFLTPKILNTHNSEMTQHASEIMRKRKDHLDDTQSFQDLIDSMQP